MDFSRNKKNIPLPKTAKAENQTLFRSFIAGFERCWERYVLIILTALLVFYCGWEFWTQGGNPGSWDPLLITGVILLITGICLSRRLPKRMDETLDRLFCRHSLKLDTDKRQAFKTQLTKLVNRNAKIAACIVAAAIMLAFIVAYWEKFPVESMVLAGLETAGGFIAGIYLGRMVGYGQLGWLLKKEGIQINVIAGHLDSVGGLKPVGDFYFFQAMVASLPAGYLAVWWFLIPAWPRYAEWREPYIGLLVIAILFEVAAFFVPTWSFHKVMQAEKGKRLRDADQLSFEIASLEAQIAQSTNADEQKTLGEQLSFKAKQYWAIENLTTWPFDAKIRRRFSLNNAVLFLPLLDKVWVSADLGKIIAEIFAN